MKGVHLEYEYFWLFDALLKQGCHMPCQGYTKRTAKTY